LMPDMAVFSQIFLAAGLTWPFLGLGGGSWAQWVGVLPGPVTGSQFWHRPIPRWRQRMEML